jgi:hypothetical protein
MTEAAEASKILVNLLRTTPYTAYLATAAAAALYPGSGADRLLAGLVGSEVLVATGGRVIN